MADPATSYAIETVGNFVLRDTAAPAEKTLATEIEAIGAGANIAQETAGNLDSLDAKQPALGTALMAASTPVTIASDDTQLTAANDVLGTTADAAIDSDTTGTISGKLRGLVKIFADAWSSLEHAIRVKIINSEWAHFISIPHPVDETDLAVNTYFYRFEVEGYRNLILQLMGSTSGTAITFKVYSTLDSTAATPASGATPGDSWSDLSTLILGSASFANNVLTPGERAGMFIVDTSVMPQDYLIEYDVDNATNSVDVWYRKY